MKIYSLQEENDKMNAARGVPRSTANRHMFETKPASRSAWQKQMSDASRQAQRTPSSMQRKQTPGPSQPSQRPVPAPQNTGKRLGMLIGWILFLLFIGIVSLLSEIL